MDLWNALHDAMRRRRSPRISRSDLDRLLAGGSPGPEERGLAALLDAATAPASPQELSGERAATAGFVAAYRGPKQGAAPERTSRLRIPSLVGAAAMRVAAVAAVLAVSGTAVAAETGSLPAAAQHRAHQWFSGLGVPPVSPEHRSPATASHRPTRSPVPSSGPGSAAASRTAQQPSPDPSGSPTPLPPSNARELCQAWQEVNEKKPGKPLPGKAGRDLLALAGNESNIPAYCTPFLDGSPATATPPPTMTASPDKTEKPDKPGKTKKSEEPVKDKSGPKNG